MAGGALKDILWQSTHSDHFYQTEVTPKLDLIWWSIHIAPVHCTMRKYVHICTAQQQSTTRTTYARQKWPAALSRMFQTKEETSKILQLVTILQLNQYAKDLYFTNTLGIGMASIIFEYYLSISDW